MPEKQKPTSDIVKKAAHFLKHPEEASLSDIKSMAARLMDDQRNAPAAHKAAPVNSKIKSATPGRIKASTPAKPEAAKAAKKSKAA